MPSFLEFFPQAARQDDEQKGAGTTMPGPVSGLIARSRGVQRALLVALVLIPVLIVTVALVPALIVLPFMKSRNAQVRTLLEQLTAWTRALLLNSRDR